MTQPAEATAEATDLQFDRADFGAQPANAVCAACQQPIADRYFDVNGQMTCATCRQAIADTLEKDPGWSAPFLALGAGLAGGLVGSIIYYAVLKLTGYEIGLIAIVVGLIVGRVVRWGSGGRGGRGYQVMAVAITYIAIVSTYVPFIIEGVKQGGAAAASSPAANEPITGVGVAIAFGMLFLFLLAMPFLAGIQNVIGLLIIGFALWEAWKANRRLPLAIAGPFALAPAGAAGGDAVVPPLPSTPPALPPLPPPDLPPAPAAS